MTIRLHLAMLATTAVLIAVGIAYVDLPLAIWFKQFDGTILREVFGAITVLGQGGYYAGAAAVVFAGCFLAARRSARGDAERWRRWGRRAIFVVAMLAATLPVNVLKPVIGRARPRMWFREEIYGFSPIRFEADYWSLPSGHAASVVALSLALYFLWPRYWPAYLVLAVLVCASRIVITTHYFADVVAGVYIATLGALIVHRLFERRYPDIFAGGHGPGRSGS